MPSMTSDSSISELISDRSSSPSPRGVSGVGVRGVGEMGVPSKGGGGAVWPSSRLGGSVGIGSTRGLGGMGSSGNIAGDSMVIEVAVMGSATGAGRREAGGALVLEEVGGGGTTGNSRALGTVGTGAAIGGWSDVETATGIV